MFNSHFWGDPKHWGPFGGRTWGHRGRRLRRGMMKFAVLKLLAEGARHGYDIGRAFRERGWGAPGPGSIYPLLNALESEGLITGRDEGDRRVYEVTEKGARHAQNGYPGESFFAADSEGEDVRDDLRESLMRFMQAASQVGKNSKPETLTSLREIVDRARKEIYTLLAEE